MKFNFKIQQYQTDAVDAVVNVFAGQPYSSGVSYIRDTGTLNQKPQQLSFLPFADNPEQMELEDLLRDSGYKNEAVALSDDQLLQNIHTLQSQNNIKLSPELVNDMGRCSLDIEMETGTGKTYVYIKTMFESSTSRYSSYISLFCFALNRLFSALTLVFDILTYFVLYVARGCLGNIWATIVFRATLFGTTQGKLKICTEFEDLAIFQSKSFFFVWRFYREKHKFCC